MRVRIAQCLCGPKRHAILALGVNADTTETPDAMAIELLKAAVEAVLAGQGAELGLPPLMNPWCGLCGARSADWVYEINWSKEFSDWDAAQRELHQSEVDQQFSALALDMLGESFDARMRQRQTDKAGEK